MNVSLKLDRSIPVVSVQGRLDARGAAAFDEVWKTLPPDASHAVLDLTGVEYLSSIGIRSLLMAEKFLKGRHGHTILAGLAPFVARVLEISGLLAEFQCVFSVPEAVDKALAASQARDGSAERTIDGRVYRIVPGSTAPSYLEVWAELDAVPENPLLAFSILEGSGGAAIDVDLKELGFAFGEGGFGNVRTQTRECIGPFVAAAKFAGVLPSDGDSISDFVLSERPEEVELVISRAIGFSGPPALEINVTTPAATSLETLLTDVGVLLTEKGGAPVSVMGFVVQGKGPQGVFLAGLFAPDSKKLYANGIFYGASPTLAPRLEDLTSVACIGPELELQSASISLYIPTKMRLGVEGRLKILVDDNVSLEKEWDQIIRRLYRDCSRVILTQLSGGYNAKTFRVASYDTSGRRLLPTVLKISTLELIRREEEAHRAYVQKFILNNSTSIMGTATVGSWAALRYNFVGISGPDSALTWLLPYYREQPTQKVLAVFHRLYTQILKPWYGQPRWEPVALYADHTPLRLFPDLCAHAERDFGFSPETETIECPELGVTLSNPFLFLRTEYAKRIAESQLWYQGINHGDLNLRNILIDEQENLYVIDFSETKPRNIVSDFARMEAIVKFETTRLDNVEDLARLIEFEQSLEEVNSIGDVPPNRYRGDDPQVGKAYAMICRLRRYADAATLFETDIVPYWLALLEWTFSVLSYDLPPLRRKLAAYSAAIICGRMRAGR